MSKKNDTVKSAQEQKKPPAEPRRDWIKAPLLRYPPRCGPLETWNEWRRYV